MNELTDQELLAAYSERQSETAFTELVRRHIDHVHSAAFRMTGEAHSAQDVTQAVFVALAQNAARLNQHPVLSGWLHTTARNLAAKNVRASVRRQNHEQEAAAMNELVSGAENALWEQIAPHLDAALAELSESDRDAVMLRYFEKKSAPQMAECLGVTEEAAQKRVSRAIERLRDLFARRGVSIGAGGLAVALSASVVKAAPAGLTSTICSAALATAAASAATIVATTTKAIVMTTLQKTLITAAVAGLAGFGIYEASQNAHWRRQIETLQQQRGEQEQERQQLQQERDKIAVRLASALNQNEQLKSNVLALQKAGRRDAAGVRAATPPAVRTAPANLQPASSSLPKDQWRDEGFATPENALKTRGWAVLNGERQRFKDSLFVTDGARRMLEDMFVKMAQASKDPNKADYLQAIIDNQLGVEDAILMPLMALNEKKGFAGYRIVSQQSPSADEKILEVETQMSSAAPERETMKFRRIDNDWKVVIDEDFVKSAR